MRRVARTAGGVVCLLVALLAGALASACGGSPAAPSPFVTPTITALPALGEMIADKAMGSANAANTVIVYSSFTCSHCADFHLQSDRFPQLKSQYIDTGKARYVFRDWERSTLDIHAAMLARCAGDARYFDAVDTLFRNQASWAGAGDQGLVNVMRQFGMSQQVIDTCLATSALSDAIVKSHADGTSQYGITGTPTFVVNEKNRVVGNLGLAAIVAYFDPK
jgi:protein-disulfide isomerase